MKILFLTPQLPFPLVSGGVFKTYKLLERLSRDHHVVFGCFLKGEDVNHQTEFDQNFPHIRSFKLELNRKRNGINYIKSFIFGVPLSVFRNKSKSFKSWVKEKSRSVDVIFIDHFLMFQYVPRKFKGKVIFHEHNAEYLLWERFAKEASGLKRILVQMEAERIKTYERRCLNRANIIFAAPNDIVALKKIHADANFKVTYHLGDDELLKEPFVPFEQRSKSLLYVGTLTWEANKDGLGWFLKNVWERIVARVPGVVLIVVGKRNEADFHDWKGHPAIKWIGFAQDLRPFYSAARVFIAPLRFGSGIKVKNINAMYRGLPIVTTSTGVEGLDLKHDRQIKIADTAEKFEQSVCDLLENKQSWESMAYESRAHAQEHFSWEAVLNEIEKEVVG